MRRSRRFVLEPLEDRCVPATFGNPWPDATHLTLSFAPDTTHLNGQTSSLFKTLNATASTASWERTIFRAFQTWATVSNVNISLVSDGGQPFGIPGRPQSDPRFGDIRIGAGNFSSEVAAFSVPFAVAAGSNSGDVRLNSAVMGKSTSPDLYSVLLHEAGLVFGLPENLDTASVMDTYYQGASTGLSAGDVSAIQAMYGARPADPYAVPAGTNPLTQAAALSWFKDANGILSMDVDSQLAAVGSKDAFSFQAPSSTGGLVVTLQRAGLSLLTPRVTVYNSYGQVVGSAASTDPTGGDLNIQVNNVRSGARYFITVEGATGDVFDVGSYKLQVQSKPAPSGLLGGLLGVVNSLLGVVLDILPLNLSFGTATSGTPQNSPNNQVNYAFHDTILASGQSEYFQVQAPPASSGDGVMNVMAWGVGNSQLVPQVTVYDANQQVVPSEVIVNEAGSIAVQVKGVTAGAGYYVKVTGPSSGLLSTGEYFLGINFVPNPEQLTTMAAGQLTPQAPSQQGQLDVQRTGLYHFVLGSDANTGTGSVLTITDASGTIVGQLLAAAGQTTSMTLSLTAGTYRLSLSAFRSDGKALSAVNLTLLMEMLSDDIGAQPQDTSSLPTSGTSTSSSGANYYSTSNPPPDSTYYNYDWTGSGPGTSNSASTGYTTV